MSKPAPRTSENHTIPDPHLTREEAEALCHQERGEAEMRGIDKLRNSLSAPLVEDGGVEGAIEALIAHFDRHGWVLKSKRIAAERIIEIVGPHLHASCEAAVPFPGAPAIQPFRRQGLLDEDGPVLLEVREAISEGVDTFDWRDEEGDWLHANDPAVERFGDEVSDRVRTSLARFLQGGLSQRPTQQHKEEEKV